MAFFKFVSLSTVLLVVPLVVKSTSDDSTCERKPYGEESAISVLADVAGDIIDRAKKYEKIKNSLNSKDFLGKPMDCEGIISRNKSANSGIYMVWPRNRVLEGPINVFCDMKDNKGGWTVIQRRGDFGSGKEYFYRDWAAYKAGFGNLKEDFWLGNDNIFALTNQRACSIKFELSDWVGNWTYATYDNFWINDEDHNYSVHVGGFRGTAGNSFTDADGAAFSTKDRDLDTSENNCAEQYKGAWWYKKCHSSNLNGFYLRGDHVSFADGVEWRSFKGYNYSLKDTVMKIRSKDFSTKMEVERNPSLFV